ncbi:MAG: isochorismatase family protein [Lachnospiraceae bacterium]|nr:isochorismatase family protein [Lachnospiraceae bacterium]MBR3242099.1 isochorismatase family protein [Parasporobacterium sp.]
MEHPSLKYLRKEHANFEIVGRPALLLNHMQKGLAGGGTFIPNWGPHAAEGIKACGMVDNCKKLVDAFHEADLPVIFCNAIPKPLPYMPAYGDLPKEQNAAFPPAAQHDPIKSEFVRKGCEVMDGVGFDPERDYVIYNWHVHPFTCSGLDQLCRILGINTLIICGFAQNSVCYSTCVVAQDYWINPIMAVDASYICVQLQKEGYYEGIDEVVTEAVIRVMINDLARATSTDAIVDKIKNGTFPGEPDHSTYYM